MTMSDPIADMLTRIRNANTAKHDTVDVPASKMKLAIAEILLNEGYIKKYEVIEDGNFKTIRITLKYGKDKHDKVISGIKKISKPGLRVYASKDELPRVLGGLGIAIILQTKVWLQIKLQEKKTLVEKFSLSFGRKKITLRDEIRLKSFSSFLVQLFIINKEVTACHV